MIGRKAARKMLVKLATGRPIKERKEKAVFLNWTIFWLLITKWFHDNYKVTVFFIEESLKNASWGGKGGQKSVTKSFCLLKHYFYALESKHSCHNARLGFKRYFLSNSSHVSNQMSPNISDLKNINVTLDGRGFQKSAKKVSHIIWMDPYTKKRKFSIRLIRSSSVSYVELITFEVLTPTLEKCSKLYKHCIFSTTD